MSFERTFEIESASFPEQTSIALNFGDSLIDRQMALQEVWWAEWGGGCLSMPKRRRVNL